MLITCKLAALTLVIVLTLHDPVHAVKIFGGHRAQSHSRPYMALLERYLADGSIKHCCGFLLNEDFMVTAAHCGDAKWYKVFLGLHNYFRQKGVQHLHVEEEFPHDNYSSRYSINDIMLLKLSPKATINKYVQPIALADLESSSLPQSCSIAGWGHTKNHSHMSSNLEEANVSLIQNQRCTEKMTYCSSGAARPERGDSGSPLVCEDGRAYGVVSLNYRVKASETVVSVYTKIAENRAWIDYILQKFKRPKYKQN